MVLVFGPVMSQLLIGEARVLPKRKYFSSRHKGQLDVK